MNTKLLIVVTVLFLTGAYILVNGQKLKQLSSTQISTSLVTELPSMQVKTMKGELKTLADFYKGPESTLVVHFWGSWCGPCETEFPSLVTLIESLKGTNYVFLLIAVNDKVEDMRKFLKKYPAPAEALIVFDESNLYLTHFGAAKVPETFVFGSDKKLLRHFVGPQDWDLPYLSNLFKNSFK